MRLTQMVAQGRLLDAPNPNPNPNPNPKPKPKPNPNPNPNVNQVECAHPSVRDCLLLHHDKLVWSRLTHEPCP